MPVVLPDEATRRSAVVWVEAEGRQHPVWHVWHDGAMYVVSGGIEQPLPALTHALVLVPVDGSMGVRWEAEVDRVLPGTELWERVVPLLHAGRLNPPDGQQQPERWVRDSMVQRFRPR